MELPWFPESFDVDRCRVSSGRHLDAILTALADLQHGAVTAAQLLALGFTRGQIRSRVKSRHLVRVGAGTYLVGHESPSLSGRRMSAVLASGRGAVLADLCAAGHLGGAVPVQAKVSVIVPPERRVERPGVVARHAVVLPHEQTVANGIPCLTWPRVFLDVAAHRGARVSEDLWHDAVYRKRVDAKAIRRLLRDHTGEPGTAVVRRLVDRRERAIGDVANRLEADLRELIIEAGMPEPRSNTALTIDGVRLRPDLYVAERRLGFETDGRDAHEDPELQLSDAARDALYRKAGIVVCRYSWWAVNYERLRVLADLVRFEAAWQRTQGDWSAADPVPRFDLARHGSGLYLPQSVAA